MIELCGYGTDRGVKPAPAAVVVRRAAKVRTMAMRSFKTIATIITLASLGGWAAAQERHWKTKAGGPTAEFHFARLMYNGVFDCYSGGGWGRGSACVDWPHAEYHFMQGLTRLTRIDGALVSRYNGDGAPEISLADDALFDYPWLYAVEVGDWYLDDYEAARLREYLLRGGFLMVDDFHGDLGWQRFYESMVRVFPDRPIIDIPETDEVLHVLYDLDQRIQIPGRRALFGGRTWEGGPDGKPPHWRGIYDDEGRLIVAINHNMDLGDAWEHADTPSYPEPMTALAYRFAVNYVIYAITH